MAHSPPVARRKGAHPAVLGHPRPVQPPTPHDALVRAIFSNPEHAAGEIRHLLDPALAKGVFPAPVVAQEREKQAQFIDSLLNDKASYAAERCGREMCRGEPFEVYEYGATKDLASVTPESPQSILLRIVNVPAPFCWMVGIGVAFVPVANSELPSIT